MKEYDLTSTNAKMFSLHDCRAKSAKWDDETLTFFFPEGIFCRNYGSEWPNTGRSAVSFSARDIQVFTFSRLGLWTVRQEKTVNELVEKLCSGKWELEFLYRYDGFREILYTGCLWSDKKPYSTECQLLFGTDTVTYRYDPPKKCTE